MVSDKDRKIIEEIIDLWGSDFRLPMLKIFGNDITTDHWIQVGCIIGQRIATKFKRYPGISKN